MAGRPHACRCARRQFEPAFAAAMAADGPTLIHLKLDTDVITSRTTLAAIREAALRRADS